MIPLFMRIKIIEKEKKDFRLLIPFFLVWILLFAFLIVLAPFILIAAIIAWPRGYGKMVIAIIPMFFAIIGSLSGLSIDVENKEKHILFSFR